MFSLLGKFGRMKPKSKKRKTELRGASRNCVCDFLVLSPNPALPPPLPADSSSNQERLPHSSGVRVSTSGASGGSCEAVTQKHWQLDLVSYIWVFLLEEENVKGRPFCF